MRRFTTGLSVIFFVLCIMAQTARTTAEYTIKISEFSTGNELSASAEFVELYNPGLERFALDGWVVQYKSAASENWITKASLSGAIESRTRYLLSTEQVLAEINRGALMSSGLAANGGHLRIAEADIDSEIMVVHDQIGWGDAASPEGVAVDAPAKFESVKRLFDEDGAIVDTNNNDADLFVSESPSPQHEQLFVEQEQVIDETETSQAEDDEEAVENDEAIDAPVDEVGKPKGAYLPLTITELFIDPESPLTDADDEFIELMNPNEVAVDVGGYELRTGKNYSKVFILPARIIKPGEYVAYYSADTNLALTNSGGGVQVYDPNGVLSHATDEYQKAKGGRAWALIKNIWQWTDNVSPNKPNAIAAAVDPVTGNKVRSSSTGVADSSSSKKVKSTNSADERIVYEDPPSIATEKINNTVLAGVGALAVLYAGYEYRHDMANKIHQHRSNAQRRREDRKKPAGR